MKPITEPKPQNRQLDDDTRLPMDDVFESTSMAEDIGTTFSTSDSTGDTLRSRRLVNRIAYIGLLLSMVAPFLHIYLNFKVMGLGPPVDMVAWNVFGVGFCGSFAVLVYPAFSVVANFVRLLDVIPALGTSLWVLGSIRLTVGIINIETPVPMLNMIWLYSFIIVNGMVVQSCLAREDSRVLKMMPEVVFRYLPVWLGVDFEYLFENGKCRLCDASTKLPSEYTIVIMSPLSVSDEALRAYKRIRNKSMMYLRGERLSEFDFDFPIWRREARRVSNLLWPRALFCVVGYLIETATLVFSFRLLKDIKGFGGIGAVSSHLPWPVAIALLLSRCSDYVPMLLNKQIAFTSLAEVSSEMMSMMSSHMDLSGPSSGYLANGQVPAPRNFPRYEETDVSELPTIGIVPEQNGRNIEVNVLRSTVTGHRLMLTRVGPGLVQTRILKDDDHGNRLQENRVSLTENDVVI